MTKASDAKPTVRKVHSLHDGQLTVEIREHTCTIRPKGCRRGGPAEISLSWGTIYFTGIAKQTANKPRTRKLRVKRGITL